MKYSLESIRRFKPYTLSEVEEKLLNLKDVNGIDALVNLYEMITNHFTFSLEVDGEKKTLTRDQLSSYFFQRLTRYPPCGLSGTLPGLQRKFDHPGPDLQPPGA